MTPSPVLIVTILGAGLLALVPVARLRAAGWPTPFLGAYWLALVGLALGLAVSRVGLRIVVPLLIVLYVAPILVVRLRGARRGSVITRR